MGISHVKRWATIILPGLLAFITFLSISPLTWRMLQAMPSGGIAFISDDNLYVNITRVISERFNLNDLYLFEEPEVMREPLGIIIVLGNVNNEQGDEFRYRFRMSRMPLVGSYMFNPNSILFFPIEMTSAVEQIGHLLGTPWSWGEPSYSDFEFLMLRTLFFGECLQSR